MQVSQLIPQMMKRIFEMKRAEFIDMQATGTADQHIRDQMAVGASLTPYRLDECFGALAQAPKGFAGELLSRIDAGKAPQEPHYEMIAKVLREGVNKTPAKRPPSFEYTAMRQG